MVDTPGDDAPATGPTSAGLIGWSEPIKQLLERRDSEIVAIVQILEARKSELQEEVIRLREAYDRHREDEIGRLKAELAEAVASNRESSRVRELEARNAELREQLDRTRDEEITRLREEVRQLSRQQRGEADRQTEADARGRPNLTPAYLAAAYIKIESDLAEADRYMVLDRPVEAARFLFDAGYRGCEVLWTLCDDADFYRELTALSELATTNLKAAQAVIEDDKKFERFLQKMLELLTLTGMEEWRAREFVTECRIDFTHRKDRGPLEPRVFRAHLRRFRDASCDAAKGDLVENIKRLEMRAQYKSTGIAIAASTVKVIATTAGSALGGPVGGAVATVLADAAVDLAAKRWAPTTAT